MVERVRVQCVKWVLLCLKSGRKHNLGGRFCLLFLLDTHLAAYAAN